LGGIVDDPLIFVVIGRCLERLAIVIIAGVCIVLGARLFGSPLENDGEANLKYRMMQMTLRRIGPGVFFALFGAAVLSLSLLKPVGFEEIQPAARTKDDNEPAEIITRYNGATSATTNVRGQVRVLNTAIRVGSMSRTDNRVLSAALEDLSQSTSELIRLRDALVESRIGHIEMELWKQKGQAFLKDASNVSESERKRLALIAPWFEETAALQPAKNLK
jgi:hypothetical protein